MTEHRPLTKEQHISPAKMLDFIVNSDGNLLENWLETSSGFFSKRNVLSAFAWAEEEIDYLLEMETNILEEEFTKEEKKIVNNMIKCFKDVLREACGAIKDKDDVEEGMPP